MPSATHYLVLCNLNNFLTQIELRLGVGTGQRSIFVLVHASSSSVDDSTLLYVVHSDCTRSFSADPNLQHGSVMS